MLALQKKNYDQSDTILKSKDITLPTKVYIVKAMVFLVVMYGCESWTIKKAGCWRIDAFQLWCWRRLLRVPWIARISNQSILKEINPVYSLEKTVMLGKIEGRRKSGDRGWDGWMASLKLGGLMSLSKLGDSEGQGSLVCCSSQDRSVRQNSATIQQQ